ncbi:hypothetical protein Tco_0597319 [Tanacetum coccineum]
MHAEQRAQIPRDEEIARQWDEEERKRAMAEAKSTKKIDWNDPLVWDFNQNIEPMDAEHGSGKQKSPKKSPEKSPEKMKSAEKMEEDDVAKETRAKRQEIIPRKSTRKRTKDGGKLKKEELKGFLDIIPEKGPIKTFDRLDVEEFIQISPRKGNASRPKEFESDLGRLCTLCLSPDEEKNLERISMKYIR